MTGQIFDSCLHDNKDIDRNSLIRWKRNFISLDLDTLPKLFDAFTDQILGLKDTL